MLASRSGDFVRIISRLRTLQFVSCWLNRAKEYVTGHLDGYRDPLVKWGEERAHAAR